MRSRPLRRFLFLLVAASLLLASSCSPVSTFPEKNISIESDSAFLTGALYMQPVDPSGKILLSAWLDPDGSNQDQYIWDNFTLPTAETITEINWYGIYDPLKFGAGGRVVDFRISIYPSIAAGTEPAIANPPLVQYQTGNNAGEVAVGTVGSATLYAYAFTLPASLAVFANTKYWVQIEAFQHGRIPDWCLAAGSDGDGSHFRRTAGAGGDIRYITAPGDAAFTLLGPIPDVPTPTDTPTDAPTDVSPATLTDTPTSTPTDTLTATATDTPTFTPTATFTKLPTDTATSTETFTPTLVTTPSDTPTNLSTSTFTSTPTDVATEPATETSSSVPPTDVPTAIFTSMPTQLLSTPGKITGGGTIGSEKDGNKSTFGFTVSYALGDATPNGNLTYQDHSTGLRLKAASFNLLVLAGDRAWFTGLGTLDNGQTVSFLVNLGADNTFSISIPALAYSASGPLLGGNITIH